MADDFEKLLDSWGRQTAHRLESSHPPTHWMDLVQRAHLIRQLAILGAIILALLAIVVTVELTWPSSETHDPGAKDSSHMIAPDNTPRVRMIDGVPRLRETLGG